MVKFKTQLEANPTITVKTQWRKVTIECTHKKRWVGDCRFYYRVAEPFYKPFPF